MKIISQGNKRHWWEGLSLECASCRAQIELESGDLKSATYFDGYPPTEPEHWELECPVCGMDIPFTREMARMQGESE